MTKLRIISALFSYFLLTSTVTKADFLDDQLKYSRVKTAYNNKYAFIENKLNNLDIKVSSFEVLLKAYKYEQMFLVYVRNKSEDKWICYDTLQFCATSGTLGPKVMEGDMQIPEGYYHINHFNPYSNFLLSLGVSYPNKADKLKRPATRKGGAIYIHGGCVTIGCIPLTDEIIEELYILSVLATNTGQSQIGIHIFPFYLTDENREIAIQNYPEHEAFWKNLAQTEKKFNETKTQTKIFINSSGDYYSE